MNQNYDISLNIIKEKNKGQSCQQKGEFVDNSVPCVGKRISILLEKTIRKALLLINRRSKR